MFYPGDIMNPGLILAWLPVAGILIGLLRVRYRRVPWIVAGVVVAAYALYLAAFGAVHPSTLWLDLAKFASDSHELTITPLTSRNGAGTAAEGIVVQAPTAAGSLAGLPRQVSMDLDAPDGFALVGVRVCYQLTNPRSTISRIRVSRPGERGKEPQLLIDDSADRTAPGPVCIDTRPMRSTEHGPITVSLRFSLQDPSDRIALRGVALLLE